MLRVVSQSLSLHSHNAFLAHSGSCAGESKYSICSWQMNLWASILGNDIKSIFYALSVYILRGGRP